jgi:AraC-like DNA-binding protein
MPSTLIATPLYKALTETFLPIVADADACPIVIARPSYKELQLPANVSATPREICGQRIAMRNPRAQDRVRQYTARWPQDKLQEARVPVVLMVAQGMSDIRICDYILHCPVGGIIFIPPGISHPNGRESHLEGGSRRQGSCDLIWITPVGEGLDCWMCHSRGEKHRSSSCGEKAFLPQTNITQYITAFEEEVSSRITADETIVRCLMQIVLVAVSRELQDADFLMETENDLPGQHFQTERLQAVDVAEQTRQYIQEHLSETLSIDVLAHKVCMSRTRFIRYFREKTGQSVNEYIADCRLARAKALLVDSDWTDGSITRLIGLSSQNYFRQFFLSRTNLSPTQYRRQMRNRYKV